MFSDSSEAEHIIILKLSFLYYCGVFFEVVVICGVVVLRG